MILDYFALFMLFAIIALVVYGIVAVYGIPYEIAKARDHPHRDAIGAGVNIRQVRGLIAVRIQKAMFLAFRIDVTARRLEARRRGEKGRRGVLDRAAARARQRAKDTHRETRGTHGSQRAGERADRRGHARTDRVHAPATARKGRRALASRRMSDNGALRV